jgi:hypothetical protein
MMSTNVDVMQFVTDPATVSDAYHGILYGPPGTGKTSTMDDDKYKVLLIDLEGGTSVLQDAKNVKRVDIPQMAEELRKTQFEAFGMVTNAIDKLQFLDYDMISIDGLTAFQEIVKEYVAQVFAPNRRREIEHSFGAQSDWGDLNKLIVRTFRKYHTFAHRGKNSQHVFWIAHVMETFDELTKKLEKTQVMLQGSSTPSQVMSIVDGYFYMYNKSVLNEKTKEYDVERGILTKQAGAYAAKARQSKRRDALPSKIVDPMWSKVLPQLGYTRGK